jgi:penicillin amidase
MAPKTVSRVLRYAAATLLLLVGLVMLAGWWVVRRSLPDLDGAVTLPELQHEVQVDRDTWGVPRIRASSLEDLVTAQGYVMAQDRLWQMDLLRRVAAGEISEILGPVALDLDRENRTLGLRQAAARAADGLAPEEKNLVEAYARGVNRYIEDHRNRLPFEFTLLRYTPRPWTPTDTFLISAYMAKSLTSTWKQELNRAKLTEMAGPERAKDLYVIDSPLDHYIVNGPSSKSADPVAAANSNHSPSAALPVAPSAEDTQVWREAQAFLAQFDEDVSYAVGSNNWVVSGAHTASGKPLLANDPHLGLGVPCIWYMIHLEAPGLDTKGFDLPGSPLLIIGHNQRIAWGFTNDGADVQDLYAETFHPANPLEYRAHGSWVPALVRHEVIHVKGRADEALDVVVTRHGPVVRREGNVGYALRWTATEPGGLDFGYTMLCRAHNWNEFRDAMRHIPGPAQNTVYADVDGNIGFIVGARIPIRKRGDGAIPVPGDTDDYEWTGYVPFDDLPQVLNPPEGVIATANARTIGPKYPYFVTERWAGPYRTARIYELLDDGRDLRPADFNAIQNDIVSLPDHFLIQQLLATAQKKQPADPRTRELIGRLASWNAQMRSDSIEASFVEQTRHTLFRNLLEPIVDEHIAGYEWWDFSAQYESVWLRDKVFLENVLRERPSRWLPKNYASFDDLLLASAGQAVAQLEKQTKSAAISQWTWGRINFLLLPHPLGRTGLLRSLLSIGPMDQSGSVDTVKAMGHGHGPSMRFVADLSDFDRSLMELTTGESGQYGSPYYRDQFSAWYEGRSLPETFSDAAETRAHVHHLLLAPAKSSAHR